MADSNDVVVIGGGFAGLSAGVALADKGFRVAVVERKPALGGRAYSFPDPDSGDFVDNGQHVLMGCYAETLAFLRKIGTFDKLIFRQDLEIEMIVRGGARARLKTARLPGPFHMSAAVLGYRHLTVGERMGLLIGGTRLLAMRRFDAARLQKTTVAELMKVLGQSMGLRENFWYPLTIATLNEDPRQASSALLAEVLKRAFFSRRADSAFVYPKVGLTDLYCGAAKDFIESRGGIVASRAGVELLELGADGVEAVKLRDGQRLKAANFVSAVPAAQLVQMLPEQLVADAFFAKVRDLRNSPIICAHVWLDREVIDSAFVGFAGTTTQWLFNKRRILEDNGERHPGYLSFVISGARSLIERSNEELLDRVIADLNAMIPASREAKVIKALVLKEKNATMAPSIESHRLRPTTITPIKNFFLAGDWVQTGLPATIESAVMSGHQAAENIIQCTSVAGKAARQ